MDNSLVRLLERSAARRPGQTAIEDAEGAYTYAALLDASRRTAAALLRRGLGGPERPVGILVPMCRHFAPLAFGVLSAGAPYLPLYIREGAGRLQDFLRRMDCRTVIADGTGRALLESFEGDFRPEILDARALLEAEPDDAAVAAAVDAAVDTDPAYLICTSGSTGLPKGVAVSHRSVLNFTGWITRLFSLSERDVFGQQDLYFHDGSVFDLYGGVAAGARVILIPEALFRFPRELPGFLAERGVTLIHWIPTSFTSVIADGGLGENAVPTLRWVISGGERFPTATCNAWRAKLPGCRFAQLYGPSECTCDSTGYVVDRPFADSEALPVGKPCDNTRIYLLRPDAAEAAPGEKGEIYIGGAGVALGYWNDPARTAEAFIFRTGPLGPERLYKTGDLGVLDGEGNLVFLGRADRQIKHRGNRIEPEEVEAAARAVPGVTNAAVLLDEAADRLVLFAETREKLTLRKLRPLLAARLPQYMLPGRLVVLEKFPLMHNNKTDRNALRSLLEEEPNGPQ